MTTPAPGSRRVATGVVGVGLVLTLFAAVAVAVIGRGSAAGDLVLVPRSEVTAPRSAAAALADEAPYGLEEVGRFEMPTAVAARPGADDLYVTLLDGRVMLLRPVAGGGPAAYRSVDQPVLDVSDQVSAQDGVEGMVGITFSPDGSTLYLAFTDKAHDLAVWAFGVADRGRSFGPGRQIIVIDRPDGSTQNNLIGGGIKFGPDGFLYVGVGDGSAVARAPDPSSLLGKLLRIVPNPAGGYDIPPGDPYGTPAGNPYNGVAGRKEVWTVGLRNPFRITFDSETGDLWVPDVGEEALEEINVFRAPEEGGNFVSLGWPQYEGTRPYLTEVPNPTDLPPTPPSYEYSHREGRCAVAGGTVYRGSELPALMGDFLYADNCGKAIFGLRESAEGGFEEFTVAAVDEAGMVSVDADNNGEVFLTSILGAVYRLVPR